MKNVKVSWTDSLL